jgi:hypothetical protein
MVTAHVTHGGDVARHHGGGLWMAAALAANGVFPNQQGTEQDSVERRLLPVVLLRPLQNRTIQRCLLDLDWTLHRSEQIKKRLDENY